MISVTSLSLNYRQSNRHDIANATSVRGEITSSMQWTIDNRLFLTINYQLSTVNYQLSVIIPANSSQIPVGKEVKVPVFAHALMVRDSRSIQAVASALSEPILPHRQSPSRHNCQKLPPDGGKI